MTLKTNTLASFIDDPRITIDHAMLFQSIEVGDYNAEEETLKEMFDELKQDDSILFPISSPLELRTRLREILSYTFGRDYEYFSHKSLLNFVAKKSLSSLKDRIEKTSDSFGKYGNPELQMVLHTMSGMFNYHCHDYFVAHIGYGEDMIDKNDDYKTLEISLKCWWSGVIWTQTPIGGNIHKIAQSASYDIRSENENAKLAAFKKTYGMN